MKKKLKCSNCKISFTVEEENLFKVGEQLRAICPKCKLQVICDVRKEQGEDIE